MNDEYRQTAALALAKCAAYDPWFPKASQAIVESWAEQVERYKLGRDDVLSGVTKMYADNGSGFRPLPKDLIDAARAVRRERDAKAGPSTDYQAICDSKAAPDESPSVTAARRKAMGSFARSFGANAKPDADRLRDLAQRQRDAAPPAPLDTNTPDLVSPDPTDRHSGAQSPTAVRS